MASICIVSVFKNEICALEEWINHYINQGVDHFFLTDNGSNDDYMSVLSKYIQSGIVTLNVNSTKYQQVQHLNVFINDAKKYEWVIIVDLDEFVYARKGFNTVKQYLTQLDQNVNQIYIPWKMFGSNGHISQPNSILRSFLTRDSYVNLRIINGKCITRTNQLNRFYLHSSSLHNTNGLVITSDGNQQTHADKNLVNISEEILKNSCLHLNHYAIQSWEWFSNVKMTRGDATSNTADHVRNQSYFEGYDLNKFFDSELRNTCSV
jgi:hypothetical protein